MRKPLLSFWITNMSNRNVTLADLNVTVKSFSSINLLDSRHYYLSLEQLKKSEESGSLFNKKNIISIRKTEPEVIKMDIPFLHETYIPSRERSVYAFKEEHYEELNITDEQFADENAELAEMDNIK
jgi:hypothetical protein